jgi:hypothetical protein
MLPHNGWKTPSWSFWNALDEAGVAPLTSFYAFRAVVGMEQA